MTGPVLVGPRDRARVYSRPVPVRSRREAGSGRVRRGCISGLFLHSRLGSGRVRRGAAPAERAAPAARRRRVHGGRPTRRKEHLRKRGRRGQAEEKRGREKGAGEQRKTAGKGSGRAAALTCVDSDWGCQGKAPSGSFGAIRIKRLHAHARVPVSRACVHPCRCLDPKP